jgi:predicted N-formylglutamate amidohydrolase
MPHAPSTGEGWPPAVEILNENGRSPIVLVCEHASNYIPPEYNGLGLDSTDLQRHIAWDVGAAHLTRELSRRLDAPAYLGTYSRLLIDLNRPTHVEASICVRSEATDIPGNLSLSEAERIRRIERVFMPFQQALGAHVEQRMRDGRPCFLVCVHSFTPIYLGASRSVHVGILFDKASAFAGAIIAGLKSDPSLNVGANVPYATSPDEDYALLVYGDNLGNPAVLIEMRHDLIANAADGERWAERLAAVLGQFLSACTSTRGDAPAAPAGGASRLTPISST